MSTRISVKSAAPITPTSNSVRRRPGVVPAALAASAVSAMMPPSPLLSARKMSNTYLRVATSMRPQNTTDTAPMRCCASSGMPVAGPKISLMV